MRGESRSGTERGEDAERGKGGRCSRVSGGRRRDKKRVERRQVAKECGRVGKGML